MPSLNNQAAFRKIGVVGAGRMGISLVHLNSSIGLETVLIGRPDPAHLARARDSVTASYAREVRRGRQTEAEADAGLARVRVTADYDALADCDAVIEAVYEALEPKREVLARVEAVISPSCVCLSTTSTIPAGMLGANLQRPGRLIVTHYIWPAHRRQLVEMAVPPGVETESLEKTLALLRLQKKKPVRVRDAPGFVVTRVLLAYWSEIVYLVRDGASPQLIDRALEGFGWPMGPCRMMDTVGIRTCTDAHAFVRPFLSDRIDGLGLLAPIVEAGYVGHRTGNGFYTHAPRGWRLNQAAFDLIRLHGHPAPGEEESVARSMGMLLNEAAHCVAENVAPDWKTVAEAIDMAFDFPQRQGGMLGYLDRIGLTELGARCARWERTLGPRFCTPDLAALPFEGRGR